MLIKKISLIRYKLQKEYTEEFNHSIIMQNLQRLKILCIVFILIEIIYEILILFKVLPYDQISQYTLLSTLFLIIVGLILILILEKKEKWFIKSILIEIFFITILLLSVCYTYIRFKNNESNLLLFIMILFVLDIAVINKPYIVITKIIGSYLVLVFLLFNSPLKNFSNTIIFNSLSFVFIAITSSIISYNNQLKIFIEKTRFRKANDRLKYISTTDQLTGLYNRRKIDKILEFQSKDKLPISIIMIDIDNFKRINDNYGHQQGDEILLQLGKVINGHLRVSDTAGRWGGEEFIIISNNTVLDEAKIMAERLREKINDYDFDKGIKVEVSMGISQMRENGNIDEVISLADKALYRAKANGRNRVET